MSSSKKRHKGNTVGHTRAIQLDRSKRHPSLPPDERIQAMLEELIQPAVLHQIEAFRNMGLRERMLTLPIMVAFVMSLIWRQFGSVREAVRELNHHGLLWADPLHVTQQAVSQRLRTFPALFFENMFREILPTLRSRWTSRQRPLSPAHTFVKTHFTKLWALDSSTLDVLLRRVSLLRGRPKPPLAGRIAAIVDAFSLLPGQIWYEPDEQAHDNRFLDRLTPFLQPGCLLLFDMGFLKHAWFDQLTTQEVWFVTRLRANAAFQVTQEFVNQPGLRDRQIELGGQQRPCTVPMRLVEIQRGTGWSRYLTNVVDPEKLPTLFVADVYRQRWRIEEAFKVVKRLLGLAYFWVGSLNGVQLQLWATWLLYAVLVDLTDAVAEELQRPFQDLSLEMIYRGLYHFARLHARGEAEDPVLFLAAHAKSLGIIKQKRKQRGPLTDRGIP